MGGGGGFLGTNLARHLRERGGRVRIFGHATPFASDLAGCAYHPGDFADTARLRPAVEGCGTVSHLIGRPDLDAIQAGRAAEIADLLPATLRLLELGAGGAFGRLVFVSSGGTVYGSAARLPIAEDAPQWPISAYGAGKLAIERFLHVHGHVHALDYRIARVANPIGPYQLPTRPQGVVAALLGHALAGTAFPLLGTGSVVRDFVAVADVAEALRRLAVHTGAPRVFNIGSGVGNSLLEMIGHVEAVLGRPVQIVRRPGRPIDVPANVLDIARAAAELDWRPVTPLRLGLQRTADWLAGRGAA